MKRLLFDAGSIATVISPLLLAVFFMSQTSDRVDSSSVVLATSELRPAMSAVTNAARAGRTTARTRRCSTPSRSSTAGSITRPRAW